MDCPKNLWTTRPKWNARLFNHKVSLFDIWLLAYCIQTSWKRDEIVLIQTAFHFVTLYAVTLDYLMTEKSTSFWREKKTNWNEINSAIEKWRREIWIKKKCKSQSIEEIQSMMMVSQSFRWLTWAFWCVVAEFDFIEYSKIADFHEYKISIPLCLRSIQFLHIDTQSW